MNRKSNGKKIMSVIAILMLIIIWGTWMYYMVKDGFGVGLFLLVPAGILSWVPLLILGVIGADKIDD